MGWIGKKLYCFLGELICIVCQTANLFLSNIAVYEASTSISFNLNALLKNQFFWFVLAIQVIYFTASSIVRNTNKRTDDKVEEAIQNGSINLVGQVVTYSQKGDFDSAKKVLKLLKKIQKGR